MTADDSVTGLLVEAEGTTIAVEAVSTDGIALALYLAN